MLSTPPSLLPYREVPCGGKLPSTDHLFCRIVGYHMEEACHLLGLLGERWEWGAWSRGPEAELAFAKGRCLEASSVFPAGEFSSLISGPTVMAKQHIHADLEL